MPSSIEFASVTNRILRGFGAAGFARVQHRLETVSLRPNERVSPPTATGSWLYLPESGVIALSVSSGAVGTVEVGLIGRNSAALFHMPGLGNLGFRYVTRVAGTAHRLPFEDAARLAATDRRVRASLAAAYQEIDEQIDRFSVCSAHHSMRSRIATRLLEIRDLVDADEIPLTHESLARLLGVRRAGVTCELAKFEQQGFVRQGWGRVTIMDRPALEQFKCCYAPTGTATGAERAHRVSATAAPVLSRAS